MNNLNTLMTGSEIVFKKIYFSVFSDALTSGALLTCPRVSEFLEKVNNWSWSIAFKCKISATVYTLTTSSMGISHSGSVFPPP